VLLPGSIAGCRAKDWADGDVVEGDGASRAQASSAVDERTSRVERRLFKEIVVELVPDMTTAG